MSKARCGGRVGVGGHIGGQCREGCFAASAVLSVSSITKAAETCTKKEPGGLTGA